MKKNKNIPVNISVNIPAEKSSYEITFPENFSELKTSLENQIAGRKAIYITDRNIVEKSPFFHDKNFFENLLVLAPGEEKKNWATIEKILDFGFKNSCDRSSVIVAIGGGVVGDMTGFASSIFMRGLPFIQVPTTLLSMVDSSIGGKTGIDTQYGKNLIGAFHQPEAVFCCKKFLETLEPIEIQNGFAEMVKHGIITSPEHFENLKNVAKKFSDLIDSGYFSAPKSDFRQFQNENNTENERSEESNNFLQEIFSQVPDSIKIKQKIVQLDEKERGIRGFLNLGHTYGHAIEHLSKFSIPHGCAVAKGIFLACLESEKRNFSCDANLSEKIKNIFESFGMDLSNPYGDLTQAMQHDKKKKNGTVRIILPKKIGEVAYANL